MDSRISNALKFSEYRVSLNNQIEQIKFKLNSDLKISRYGGTFTATTDTMGFLKYQLDKGVENVILVDANGTPVEISDITDFLETMESTYKSATHRAYTAYERLRKARRVESIVDYKPADE